MEIEDFFKMLFSRENKISFARFMIGGIAIMFTFITTIDLFSNDDSMSSNSALNENNVQFEIRKNENKFREKIFKQLSTLTSDKSFSTIDSIFKTSNEKNDIKKYLILNKLKSTQDKFEFKLKLEKTTSPLVVLDNLNVSFEIDFNKLNNIIAASSSKITEENIKYGNYLKTFYTFDKKIRFDYLIIAVFTVFALFIILYFANRIGIKTKKDKLENTADNLKYIYKRVTAANRILSLGETPAKEIERLKELYFELEKNLKTNKFDNVLKSVLYEDVIKSERKSLELYNRSTLMLILGLLVAVAGVFVFYVTLPQFENIKKPTEYLALTIRPTLILIFIQSIAFYLLKQYRSLINDYKFFHNEYLKKSKVFTVYQLMQSEKISDVEMKLIDSLLKEDSAFKDLAVSETEINNEKIIDLLKSIIDKSKG